MLAIQMKETMEDYQGNIKTLLQIISFNGKWRHLTDEV